MASKEPDKGEKAASGGDGFTAIAGVYILGMGCCLAGPAAVLAGVAGIRAWFNGLHPFLIAMFTLVAAIFAIVWISRRRRHLRPARSKAEFPGSNDCAPEKAPVSKISTN